MTRRDRQHEGTPPEWLDAHEPHDAERCARQRAGLQASLAGRTLHVLELGCGGGRVIRPLLEMAHAVVAMDRDDSVIRALRSETAGIEPPPELVVGDFLNDSWPAHPRYHDQPFDAVLLLGNTLMTVTELDTVIALFKRIAGSLRPGGRLLIDDLPQDLWPELTEGHWQSGISEDGTSQLVWAADDSVFSLRLGEAVDPERWTIDPGDTRYRLWTMSGLTLLGRLTGLSDPEPDPGRALIVFRRPE